MQNNERFMPDANSAHRLEMLHNNATQIKEGAYTVELSDDERAEQLHKLSELDIKLGDLEDEKKAIVGNLTTVIKNIKEEKSVIRMNIKTNTTDKTGKQFLMANHDEGYMYTYNEEGYLIGRRRLFPDEKQTNIFDSKLFDARKTG